jgi:hypothetical protein
LTNSWGMRSKVTRNVASFFGVQVFCHLVSKYEACLTSFSIC